jgi:hypothetical protein
VTFSTKYLAEAIVLLGIAWAVIRWVGRSLLDISGGSRDAEGHRLLESMWRTVRKEEKTVYERAAPREATSTSPHEPRYPNPRRALDVAFRELCGDESIAEGATSMSESERQAIYDDLVRQLDASGVTDAERAFALAVALRQLGLKGGRAATDVAETLRRSKR